MKLIYTTVLVFIASFSHSFAEPMFGLFYYKSDGFIGENGIKSAPENAEIPAFFIYDDESKELRIFNFLDRYYRQNPYDIHAFHVRGRHSDQAEVVTFDDLINFAEVEWIHTHGSVFHTYQLKVDEDGSFSYTYRYREQAELIIEEYGSGTITKIVPSTREDIVWSETRLQDAKTDFFGSTESWLFIRFPTSVGYKYKIYSIAFSERLGRFRSEVSISPWDWHSGRTTNDNSLIGNGREMGATIARVNLPALLFLQVEAIPITIEDFPLTEVLTN